MHKFYPLKFTPVYKHVVWGGTWFSTHLCRNISGEDVGESWEVSCHKNGTTSVENGEFAGVPLDRLVRDYPVEILGSAAGGQTRFPLLFKLIDANADLSVQVHPNDAYAAANEGGELGKTEMWYIVAAQPGAKIAIGLAHDMTKSEFLNSVQDGTIGTHLNYINVKAGDSFFIPAGLVHAIGAGVVVAEIQQNSDTTYRVYDYGRVGVDGKPRELHVSKAADVSMLTKYVAQPSSPSVMQGGYSVQMLAQCEYFTCCRVSGQLPPRGAAQAEGMGFGQMQTPAQDSDEACVQQQGAAGGQLAAGMIFGLCGADAAFSIVHCLSDSCDIRHSGGSQPLKRGETVLVPACVGAYGICGEALIIAQQ